MALYDAIEGTESKSLPTIQIEIKSTASASGMTTKTVTGKYTLTPDENGVYSYSGTPGSGTTNTKVSINCRMTAISQS